MHGISLIKIDWHTRHGISCNKSSNSNCSITRVILFVFRDVRLNLHCDFRFSFDQKYHSWEKVIFGCYSIDGEIKIISSRRLKGNILPGRRTSTGTAKLLLKALLMWEKTALIKISFPCIAYILALVRGYYNNVYTVEKSNPNTDVFPIPSIRTGLIWNYWRGTISDYNLSCLNLNFRGEISWLDVVGCKVMPWALCNFYQN